MVYQSDKELWQGSQGKQRYLYCYHQILNYYLGSIRKHISFKEPWTSLKIKQQTEKGNFQHIWWISTFYKFIFIEA